MFSLHNTALALLATSVGLSYAVYPATVKGPNFLDTSGKRFKLVGIDYQPGGEAGYDPEGGHDVLSNGTACMRDAALMQELGVNTVRVYNLDPLVNHDECMSIFNEVGIYMVLDVNSPFESLNRDDPASTYTETYLTRVFGIIENFKAYPNTLGFFAANEVMNDLGTAKANPPYVRALVRDMKTYIQNNADRAIPVGYSAADVRPILEDTWNYLQCTNGANDLSQSDFLGLNSYSWCGRSSVQKSGYDILENLFSPSAIPVFFSEYGCNEVQPRVFTEVPAIYGPAMDALSGGLVYQWTQDSNDFGLLKLDEGTGTVQLLGDFDTLQSQYNSLQKQYLAAGPARNVNAQAPKCSPSLITHPQFSKSFRLPAPPPGAAKLIASGISSSAAYRGKLVSIGSTKVTLEAFTSKGDRVEPFEIKPLPSGTINTPSGGDINAENAGNGGSPTLSGASESSSGAALGGRAVGDTALQGGSLLALLVAIAGFY
jgi:hypothetical protein